MTDRAPRDHLGSLDFRLTHRQRRLRTLTAVILLTIGAMVVFGLSHPFFRSSGDTQIRRLAREAVLLRHAGGTPDAAGDRARRVVAVRLTLIALYWSVCFCLTALLVVLAWLDAREVRRRLLLSRSAMARLIRDRPDEDRETQEGDADG
ncbi:MAG: hypothetical protein HUU17_09565 [Chthonomonadales bacterium]|nr:hypothetical protein [Chthonomonadales bacterium]